MTKMSKNDLYWHGLIDQKDTWWGKKIIENENRVEAGEFGEVLKTWKEFSGWMDGVKLTHYIVYNDKIPKKLYVNENGIHEVK